MSAELLDAIAARPDDDAVRLVYADWLVERGDPRGELIQLQIARGDEGEPTARERELLGVLGKTLLGELAPHAGTFDIRRGFLSRCWVEGDLSALVGRPIWATVRELYCDKAQPIVPLVTHPVMRSLRMLGGNVFLDDVKALTTGAPLALEYLGFRDRGPKRLRKTRDPVIRELRALPALRHLSVGDLGTELAWWLGGRIGEQLDTISFAMRMSEVAPLETWLDALARTRIGWMRASNVELARAGDRFDVKLAVLSRSVEDVARIFANVEAARLGRFVVSTHHIRPDERARVEAALARFAPEIS